MLASLRNGEHPSRQGLASLVLDAPWPLQKGRLKDVQVVPQPLPEGPGATALCLTTENQPPKLAMEDQLPTMATDDQPPTVATEDQPPTLPTEDQPPAVATEDQLPTPGISPAGPGEASPEGQRGRASSRAQPQSGLWPVQEPEHQQKGDPGAGHSGVGDTGAPGQRPAEGRHPPHPEEAPDAGGDTGAVRAAEDGQAPRAAAEQVGGNLPGVARGVSPGPGPVPGAGRVSRAWCCPRVVRGRGLHWNHVPGVRGVPGAPTATARGLLRGEDPGRAPPPAGLPASCPLRPCVPVGRVACLRTAPGWLCGRRRGTQAPTAPGMATQGRCLRARPPRS